MKAIKEFLLRFRFVRDMDLKIRGPRHKPGEAELRAIEALCLSPDTRFSQIAAKVAHVDGMLSTFSTAVMDMLLSFQERLGAKGGLLEIGTYKGKSAIILGEHLRPGERLTLVDITDYLDRAAIEPYTASMDFLLMPSDKLRRTSFYSTARAAIRFSHIDASHGYTETFAELQMADELLAPLGIIALDDFTNLHHSQNIAAIFKYLYTTRTDLVPFMVTDIKAYLCRRGDFPVLSDLVFKTGIAEMASRGQDVILARTSYEPEYRAFYMRPREPEDTGAFYGRDTYKNQILGL